MLTYKHKTFMCKCGQTCNVFCDGASSASWIQKYFQGKFEFIVQFLSKLDFSEGIGKNPISASVSGGFKIKSDLKLNYCHAQLWTMLCSKWILLERKKMFRRTKFQFGN